jgi:outer membrane receptor for monomeric catechols
MEPDLTFRKLSMPTPRRLVFNIIFLLAAAGSVTALEAQSTAAPPVPAPGATAPASDNVTEMEKFTVSEVPVENQILPTVRPVDSVLGDGTNIIDIPRSVTTVNKAWMVDRQVTDSMDLGQFSPGVYSPARYGVPATPLIRGDNAQIYDNGQQTLFTTESILPSFNGVEAMDIVKGPGSAVYGPQSQGPGGYANFVTKQPYFDRDHTDVSVTLGQLTSDGSYWNPEFSIDTGGPISDKVAYRVSYLSRYGDGYYEDQRNRTQDIFTALTLRPSNDLTVQWWGQWYGNLFAAVTGANRVTQQFIDHGTYVGGSVDAFPDTPPFGLGNVDGSFGVLDQATAYTTKLAWNRALISPGDSARTGRFQTQLIATLDLGSDAKIVNRTYLESANDRQYNLWGYSEYMPVQESVQDRLEFHRSFTTGAITQNLIAGGDFRYTRIVAYQNYAIEPFFYFDLAQSPSKLVFPAYAQEGSTLGAEYAIPGMPGYGAYLASDSANQDSHIYDAAPFIQDNIGWTKVISTVIGLRDDWIKADDESPSLVQVFDPVTGTVYPHGINLPHGSLFSASDKVTDPSYFLSLVFKTSATSSVYFTYNRVDSILGSNNFGGVNVAEITDGANTPIGTPSEYHSQLDTSLKTKSALYEVGYKQSFLNNTLYGSMALYQQVKTEPQVRGPNYLVKSQGLELEAVYQPSKSLSLNGNFTYQNVTDFGSAFFQQSYSYLDGYPSTLIVDGQPGTENGSPNFSAVPANGFDGAYTPTGNRMKAPGVPQVLANLFMQYQLHSGFGIGIGPQIQGRQYADDEEALHIPTEYELDGYVFYRAKEWDVQINVKNITDRRILDPIDVTFAGNDVIYVRPPISAGITFRYHL